MKSEDKQKTVQDILQMLNGLNYADAKEILEAAHERVLDTLKIILPEAEQPPQDSSLNQDDVRGAIKRAVSSTLERLNESGIVYSED